MALQELERTCKNCGHKWIPRKTIVNKCPKCNAVLPKYKRNFLTRRELKLFFLTFVALAIFMMVFGSLLSFMFLNALGFLMGLISMNFFLIWAMRFYVELRIYSLLHKPYEPAGFNKLRQDRLKEVVNIVKELEGKEGIEQEKLFAHLGYRMGLTRKTTIKYLHELAVIGKLDYTPIGALHEKEKNLWKAL